MTLFAPVPAKVSGGFSKFQRLFGKVTDAISSDVFCNSYISHHVGQFFAGHLGKCETRLLHIMFGWQAKAKRECPQKNAPLDFLATGRFNKTSRQEGLFNKSKGLGMIVENGKGFDLSLRFLRDNGT
ncbi:hypothetical protein [Methyloglobulus sp.]|uniref:hypothetical protein n=1 Tax=Methyloglobulus sp. TaxID=2518622 RepID=UPI00183EFF4D|nr:hypothetical protein [Methyloglobulus sp.]